MKCLESATSRAKPHYRLNCSFLHRFAISCLISTSYKISTKLGQPSIEAYHHYLTNKELMCISFYVKTYFIYI